MTIDSDSRFVMYCWCSRTKFRLNKWMKRFSISEGDLSLFRANNRNRTGAICFFWAVQFWWLLLLFALPEKIKESMWMQYS